ncbi:MAG: tRNA preQ1(34) S-adenosylmethionine ribosyltransferase-isomerase QueA [Hydrogenophilus sp.]|nr:tRNA preQ1(34) S-adenosylmethionine ribosyltransferase-isomerase QueA [Hydrogenophilus sp.]
MNLCQEPNLDLLDAYDYPLPDHLIARYPPPERGHSRLLVVEKNHLEDRHFTDLPHLLTPRDLLVVNDSRVLHARLRGRKATGGAVELLFERLLSPREALALIRANRSPKIGTSLILADAFTVEILGRRGECYHLRLCGEGDLLTLIEQHGELPLPPYLQRPPTPEDEGRYQTIYSRAPGSVAAPTAGLHFTHALFEQLHRKGIATAAITLHVGAGTFLPVRHTHISRHTMHREWFSIPPATVAAIEATRAVGGRVVAVGTTVLRTLEGAILLWGELRAGSGETDLFIRPGFRFRIVDALITNFHLPRSTLLMLVAAFAGYRRTMAAYQHAIAAGYRFYSYGDAMFIPFPFGSIDHGPPHPLSPPTL